MLERSIVAGALVLLSAVAQSQSAPTWRVPCPFDSTKALLPVTCGRLRVAENPDRPGRTVEVAFMRVSAPRTIDDHGPIVWLNGGPGDNSLFYAEELVTHPHIRDVVVDRDWIFFDQRGSGRSTPQLYCEPAGDWMSEVRACRSRLASAGVDLSQYNSARIAGDMEALRQALGIRQWNLWGISYGGRLAVITARTYPTSIRSIILDASGVPEGEELIDDARGTEVALNKIFSKCATDAACSRAYPDFRNRFHAGLIKLRQQPLTVGERRYDDAALLRFIRAWLYPRGYSTFETRIQSLLVVMDAAIRGDAQFMAETQARMRREEGLPRPEGPPLPLHGRYSTGLNLSVYCHESQPFQSSEAYSQARARSEILRALLPGFGTDASCDVWNVPRADTTVRTRIYDGPQLVLTGELDASSSGIEGYSIVMLNAHAKQVVFRNGMHGQWPRELPTAEDTDYRLCALRLARAFIADPQRRLDTSCAETRTLRLVR